ncbi:MAG: hypothetical protein HWD90_02070 [Campylobacteraceae bacterium]|nr:hypothetical protein [Campylobacteraceae bacterium]
MKKKNKPVNIELDDGTIIKMEATDFGGEIDIADENMIMKMEDFNKTIIKIAASTIEPLKETTAKKISLKMGLSLGIESGELTALLVKGTGTANFEVTLEWENE